MAWLAVDKDGTEGIFPKKPYRCFCQKEPYYNSWDYDVSDISLKVTLPKGTIKELICRKLTWEDEPVEI